MASSANLLRTPEGHDIVLVLGAPVPEQRCKTYPRNSRAEGVHLVGFPALLAGSPTIDAASNVGCPNTDQRGFARPRDGDGDGTATCDIGAFERGPNRAPVARANSFAATEDKILTVPPRGVLKNDTDADSDRLSARVATRTGHGTLTLKANGSLTYKPDRNFNGLDSFTYWAFDGKATSKAVKAIIRVKAVPN